MKMSVRNSSKSRAALSAAPFPRAPIINPKLGTGRLMNAAALLSQQIPHR
jgi:hypothetical protein